MSDGTGVLIVGEMIEGRLTSTTKELLNAGGTLAKSLGLPLQAALLGTNPGHASHEAITYGAMKVLLAEHPLLDEGYVEAHVAALQRVCQEAQPNVLLIARTQLGRELGPRLAFRLGVGLAQDAVGLTVHPSTKQLLVTRPVYGGNAMAIVSMSRKPQIITVRPKAFEAAAPDESLRGELVQIPLDIPDSVVRGRVVERVSEATAGVKLEEARVVVAGGRGLGGPEPFQELEKLAKLLGGTIGASRPACDAGWIDPRHQIGLTGKTITPELYIAVAISGACQHMAGCSGAKAIVAINNDGGADIFKEARYGVIGDWRKILPAFAEAVRELVS